MTPKETIWTWETAPDSPGAGIIIVRKFDDKWKVLGLWSHLRNYYDIPKGHIEGGDTPFETALRETAEECNITELDFIWGNEYIKLNKLIVYLATTTQDPKILKNKESGIYEHSSADWLEWDCIEEKAYEYLKAGFQWAKKKVDNEVNN